MRIKLNNKTISAEIDTHGAELKSAKIGDREYMWCGDAKFWGRTSPVLFPFVGAVAEGKYRHDGKTYDMGQHGFARDCEFECTENTDDKAVFVLKSDENTLKKYPFDFELQISYELKDNTISVAWLVKNTGSATMPFSIGAHPAFNCELDEKGTLEGNKVILGDSEVGQEAGKKDISYSGKSLIIRKFHDPLAANETYEFTPEDGKIIVDEHTFDGGAIILEDKQITSAGIMDAAGNIFVRVDFEAPLIGIWSPTGKNAPFICLEPWYGRADAEGFNGELSEREHGQLLSADDTFDAKYTISLFE
ncbi:aldose 1-epimerase family protein [Butyrivibrio sp. AE3004]|uniref:aldose 1-epimerase family protein n=1 Tax=Butyrivibrio sp. AE3004 TaxID=1506994 RepID=UPI0004943332|nr:aldose 1-epimerase family protein [Butyrivibrio sp. AE3004]